MLIAIKNNCDGDIVLLENEIIYLESACTIKQIKAPEVILLLDNMTINDDGLIVEKNIYIDEILISLSINSIITSKYSEKLEEVCRFYHINLIVI